VIVRPTGTLVKDALQAIQSWCRAVDGLKPDNVTWWMQTGDSFLVRRGPGTQ